MATLKEWQQEINSMTKDELTMALSAYERLLKWNFFAKEFELRSFFFYAEDIKNRIEHLARFQGGFSRG
jgi:hypothetical protein